MINCHIEQLSLHNFKNFALFSYTPKPGLNIILGPNGAGKTNILESLALLCSLKSLRPNLNSSELIKHSYEFARIKAQFASELDIAVSISITPQNKQLQIDGSVAKNASALLQRVALVSFVPEDLNIILSSSQYRRRALDQLSASLFPSYSDMYRRYEKALLSRNRLLKSGYYSPSELQAYTHIFIESGTFLIKKRLEALRLFSETFYEQLQALNCTLFPVQILYKSFFIQSLISEDNIAELFADYLNKHQDEEKFRKITSAGPHLDDICFIVNGQTARQVASRGQARVLVLAWKIAHLLTVIRYRHLAPILLLDDVVGELDQNHAEKLSLLVADLAVQTFISTTHRELLPHSTQEIGSIINL